MSRYILQNQVEKIYGIPLELLWQNGIKPVDKVSTRRAKRYDTKLIDMKLDELSGLTNNRDITGATEINWEQELINRAMKGNGQSKN